MCHKDGKNINLTRRNRATIESLVETLSAKANTTNSVSASSWLLVKLAIIDMPSTVLYFETNTQITTLIENYMFPNRTKLNSNIALQVMNEYMSS